MKLLATTLEEGTSIQGSQRNVVNLSKNLNPGNLYRIFLPVNQLDNGKYTVAVAVAPVRKLDYKKLGHATFVINDFEQTEGGKIIDHSGLAPLSRISRIMLDAECKYAKDKARKDAQDEADLQSGGKIDEASLAITLQNIEEEYHGNKDKSDCYAKHQAAIGGVDILMVTECFCVPLDAQTKKPKWNDGFFASIELRSTKAQQISTCLKDVSHIDTVNGLLEVSYDYSGSTDKQKLGRICTFQGVAQSEWLQTTDTDSWDEGLRKLSGLSRTGEAIASKNMSLNSTVSAAEVQKAYLSHISKQAVVINKIDMDAEITKKAAKDLLEFQVGAKIDGFADKLRSLAIENGDIVENAEDAKESRDNTSAEGAADVLGATTIAELEAVDAELDDLSGEIEEM